MIIKRLNSYLAVGVINFLVCISVMVILQHQGYHYLCYTIIGYTAAICCSYLLNSYFTFNYNGISISHFCQFAMLNGSNLLLVGVIEMLLIEHFHLIERLAVIMGMVWYTLVGFAINQRVVFKRD